MKRQSSITKKCDGVLLSNWSISTWSKTYEEREREREWGFMHLSISRCKVAVFSNCKCCPETICNSSLYGIRVSVFGDTIRLLWQVKPWSTWEGGHSSPNPPDGQTWPSWHQTGGKGQQRLRKLCWSSRIMQSSSICPGSRKTISNINRVELRKRDLVRYHSHNQEFEGAILLMVFDCDLVSMGGVLQQISYHHSRLHTLKIYTVNDKTS